MKKKRRWMIVLAVILIAALSGAVCGRLLLDSIMS